MTGLYDRIVRELRRAPRQMDATDQPETREEKTIPSRRLQPARLAVNPTALRAGRSGVEPARVALMPSPGVGHDGLDVRVSRGPAQC